VPVLVLARHAEPGRHLPILQGEVSAMKKPHKCCRCRLTDQHMYQRGDGKWLCQPCVVLLMYDAEVIEANRALDAWVERQSQRQRGVE